ncbi:MAG: DinB family protein [Actinomycetota bacterium]|nr:DinB family protein [Actinomycetota bacterium]
MTRTPAVADDRPEPAKAGGELETLLGFLDYLRDTVLWKVGGLRDEQLRAAHPPSPLTLAGLVKHLAYVEDNWSSDVLLGNTGLEPWASADWAADRDWEMTSAGHDTGVQLIDQYTQSRARSDAILRDLAGSVGGLDTLSKTPDRHTGEAFSLRWVLVHLIEEYARHLGHADLIREAIDGETGE